MVGLFEQVPVQAALVIPLSPLADLAAHEEQLLTRMSPHVAVESAQVGELLPAVALHLIEQRAFAVNHLVVREGENVILAPRIEKAEGEIVVMILTIDGVPREVE